MHEIKISQDNILIIKITSIITANELLKTNEDMLIYEKEKMIRKRLIDIRDVQSTKLDFNNLIQFRTVRNTQNPEGKTAYLYNSSLGLGFARMWQQIAVFPKLEIEVFDNETTALNWLNE